MTLSASLTLVRDTKYYFPDGNTVILIENTLFKVHRFQLIQDQSAFEGMFSCPRASMAPSESPEGESDDNPIRLQGDSVEEMRALMGYLYSLPHEFQTDLTDDDVFHQRCRLARIAHKYHFGAIEKWTLDAIKAFWMSHDENSRTSITRLVETTIVASLCQHADLLGVVTRSWIKIVNTHNVSNIRLAIQIAEQHGLPSVKGRAYYAMMLQGRDVWKQDGILTPPQRLTLLSGFHDLAQAWHRIEKGDPPEISHSGCTSITHPSHPSPSEARCKLAWTHLWKMIFRNPEIRDAFLSLSPADVTGRLSFTIVSLKPLHDEMLASTGQKMTAACLMSASATVKELSASVTRGLPDIFMDLT